MKIVNAKILDSTHLELKQPILAKTGILIKIYIPDETDEDTIWKESAKKHFLESYDLQDDIYDKKGVNFMIILDVFPKVP